MSVMIKQPTELDGVLLEKVIGLVAIDENGNLSNLDPTELGGGGGSGLDGKSAYQVAVDEGFEGTEAEWLESLVGAAGLSAYEVAVKEGYVGTASEWLETLVGTAGKSAYEVAVDEGFVGTEEEWLASLKGEKGDPGEGGSGSSIAAEITDEVIEDLEVGTYVCTTEAFKDAALGYPDLDGNTGATKAFVEIKGNWAHLVTINVTYDNGATYTKVATETTSSEWLQVVGVNPGTVLLSAGTVVEGP